MKPKGSPCRDAVGECDLDEVCNGDSGECPVDLFLKNGKPCMDTNGQQGYCFNGDCPTTSQQCQVHHRWDFRPGRGAFVKQKQQITL